MNGEMILSEVGKIVERHIQNASKFNSNIEIPIHVVMPNHIHMIVLIVGSSLCDVDNAIPITQRNPNPALRANPTCQRHVPTLSRYLRSFKASVTAEARKVNSGFVWQSRYHDHLIRGSKDGDKIFEYILNNPKNWNKDCFCE